MRSELKRDVHLVQLWKRGYVHSTTQEMAGWSRWSAREPHKLEVVGSNPTPAPKLNNMSVETEALMVLGILAGFCISLVIILDQEQK